MTLRKIRDFTPRFPAGGNSMPAPCLNPSHNPPSMIVLSPGEYEHTCPGCGAKVRFVVPLGPMC